MIRPIAASLFGIVAALAAPVPAGPVAFTVHSGYFEKNDSGLSGPSSYLVVDDRADFDKLFGVAFTTGTKPKVLADDAFETSTIVAVIERGGEVWTYQVDGVQEENGTLTVRYRATAADGGGARFASPLILSVRPKVRPPVVFIENGKEVGRVAATTGAAAPGGEPTTRSFTYKTTPDARLELVVHQPPGAKDTDRRPAVLFFFGGGWANGNIRQFEIQADHLARRGLVTVRADYRVKSRQGVAPDKCVEDAKSAVRWLRANASNLGIDPDRIVAAGGSAGGHIAACTALTEGLEAEGEDLSISSRPNALVLFNPVLRFDGVPELMGRIGQNEALGRQISPTLHASKDTPPTLLFYGTNDRLFEQGREFMDRSTEQGFRAELFTARAQKHGFFNRPPWQARTTARMDEFLASLGYLDAPADATPAAP